MLNRRNDIRNPPPPRQKWLALGSRSCHILAVVAVAVVATDPDPTVGTPFS